MTMPPMPCTTAVRMHPPTADAAGLARLRLWQLLSPTLPMGAYSYSGGLETAVQQGWVRNLDDTRDWLEGQLRHTLGRVDIPLLARLHRAWACDSYTDLLHHSRWLRACRETSELAAEDHQMGRALARLLRDLEMVDATAWVDHPLSSWATLHALAMVRWDISLEHGAQAYLWAWCESQVAAAVKLVPLGQTDGQRLLLQLAPAVVREAGSGLLLDDAGIGGGAPGVAIASSLHQTQYSRLFRS